MKNMKIDYSNFPSAAIFAIASTAVKEAVKTGNRAFVSKKYAVDPKELTKWINHYNKGTLEKVFTDGDEVGRIEWRNVPNAPRMAVRKEAISMLQTKSNLNKSKVAKRFGTTAVTIKRWEMWETNGNHRYQKRGRKRIARKTNDSELVSVVFK